MTEDEETFFVGNGEITVKKIELYRISKKIKTMIATGPVGYRMLEQQIEREKVKGLIRLKENLIECDNKQYHFNKIQSAAKVGTVTKSIIVKLVSHSKGKNYLLTLGIRTEKLDKLFTALEKARTSQIEL